MKYLTQATYHSPGAKSDQATPELPIQAQISSSTGADEVVKGPHNFLAANEAISSSPGILSHSSVCCTLFA